MREGNILELDNALLSDVQWLRGVCGNAMERVVCAGAGVEEVFESVCG